LDWKQTDVLDGLPQLVWQRMLNFKQGIKKQNQCCTVSLNIDVAVNAAILETKPRPASNIKKITTIRTNAYSQHEVWIATS